MKILLAFFVFLSVWVEQASAKVYILTIAGRPSIIENIAGVGTFVSGEAKWDFSEISVQYDLNGLKRYIVSGSSYLSIYGSGGFAASHKMSSIEIVAKQFNGVTEYINWTGDFETENGRFFHRIEFSFSNNNSLGAISSTDIPIEIFPSQFQFPVFFYGVIDMQENVFLQRLHGRIESANISTVPEPQSWALMFLGFGFVGAISRSQIYRRNAGIKI